ANLTITNADLVTKRSAAQNFIRVYPERTKLHHVLEKFLKKTKRLSEDFQDDENDIRVDAALLENKRFVYETVPTGQGQTTKVLAVDPTKAKELQRKLRDLERKEISVEVDVLSEEEAGKDLEAA